MSDITDTCRPSFTLCERLAAALEQEAAAALEHERQVAPRLHAVAQMLHEYGQVQRASGLADNAFASYFTLAAWAPKLGREQAAADLRRLTLNGLALRAANLLPDVRDFVLRHLCGASGAALVEMGMMPLQPAGEVEDALDVCIALLADAHRRFRAGSPEMRTQRRTLAAEFAHLHLLQEFAE